jgi:hypothetical protein
MFWHLLEYCRDEQVSAPEDGEIVDHCRAGGGRIVTAAGWAHRPRGCGTRT